jgi:hypothetical protein
MKEVYRMTILLPTTSTSVSSDEFVEEQLSFSTADVQRIEFCGEIGESYGGVGKPEERPRRFRLVDGDLFAVAEEQLPPNAQPLTEDAGIFRIIGTTT